MQQAATVRVPSADRTDSLEEMATTRLRMPVFTTEPRTTGDQGEHEGPCPDLASRAVLVPFPFGPHGSSSSSSP